VVKLIIAILSIQLKKINKNCEILHVVTVGLEKVYGYPYAKYHQDS